MIKDVAVARDVSWIHTNCGEVNFCFSSSTSTSIATITITKRHVVKYVASYRVNSTYCDSPTTSNPQPTTNKPAGASSRRTETIRALGPREEHTTFFTLAYRFLLIILAVAGFASLDGTRGSGFST
jgi:hypothetical protein